MEGAMILVFIVIGLCAGVLSGLFGIGGGVIIVPSLAVFARMAPHMAIGTSLGALLLPVGLLGAMQYYKAGHLDVRASLLIALGLFVGVFAGAKLGLSLAPVTIRRLFAVFLAILAVRMWLSK
jgi:uncharacterized membrane protein YfcA